MMENETIQIKSADFEGYRPKCKFIFSLDSKEKYVQYLKDNKLDKNIIKDADKICAHIFNILGSGDRYLGNKIKWNEDFKTSFTWKNDYYKNIKIVDLTNSSDVKVPWELSRFQHLFTLGKAYWITGDEKYAMEFRDEISDWIDKNPYEKSVNWVCAMDTAIRAVNWIIGYYFFESSITEKEFWNEFNKTLYLHGIFIMNNLENKGDVRSNHYLSDLAGLIFLGIYFNNYSKGTDEDFTPKAWLDIGVKELEKEMLLQVNEDGTCYEDSTSYHRLDTELFLLPLILCNKNEIIFSSEYMRRLEKMFEFIRDITKPNGLVPFFGDADDGRLIIFSKYSSWIRKDFRHILAIAGEYFDRDDFRYYGTLYKEDALWAVGSVKKGILIPPKLSSCSYEEGQYFVLRNDRIYCMIASGELSFKGQGGHSHNDQLSFELNVDGEDFIIDPGVFVYTADIDMRNLYRSTIVHNTVYIEGIEQNDFTQEPFELKEETFGRCISFTGSSFTGRHYGYKNKCGVVHERNIELKADGIIIEDRLIGQMISDRAVFRTFTLDSDVEVNIFNNMVELNKNGKSVKIKCDNVEEIKTNIGYISYSYGTIMNTKRIEIKSSCNNKEMRLELYI